MRDLERTLLVICIIAATAAAALGQDFRVGDTVEAHSYMFNPPWHKATVISVGDPCYPNKPFRVHFVGPDAGDHGDPCVAPDEIRALADSTPADDGGDAAGNGNPPANTRFKVGDRVDVFAANNRDKGARGTIIEIAGGRYKIHYDGCEAHKDVVVDSSDLHPAATISANAASITFLFGAWKMFTPSYPNTVVHGNTIYREYGTGASAPPLKINSDGTYVWFDQFNKPPVRGTWTADAKVEGAKYWTAFTDGVVIKDSAGAAWKAYRWKYSGDNVDRITVQTQCSGMTMDGTRIR